jgi:hypothetical protein
MRALPKSTTDMFGRTWFVRICNQPYLAGKVIDIYYKQGEDYYHAQPMKLEFAKVDRGAYLKDSTLELEMSMEQAFLQALTNEINESGMSAETDSKVRGKLEATLAHLDDMRKLVFTRKK